MVDGRLVHVVLAVRVDKDIEAVEWQDLVDVVLLTLGDKGHAVVDLQRGYGCGTDAQPLDAVGALVDQRDDFLAGTFSDGQHGMSSGIRLRRGNGGLCDRM